MKHDFVNVLSGLNPNARDAAERRNVRVLSMRSFRRFERDKRVAAYRAEKQKEGEEAEKRRTGSEEEKENESQENRMAMVGEFVLSEKGYGSPCGDFTDHWRLQQDGLVLGNTWSNIAGDFIDPFQSTSMYLHQEQQYLLTLFTDAIGPTMVPLTISKSASSWAHQWLDHALASPVLLLATCAHASRFQDAYAHRPESDTSLKLKIATMGIVKRSLAADDVGDDGICGAIGLMAADAMISGAHGELALHMAALRRDVEKRGGDENLGMGGLLKMTFAWHQAPTAILCHDKSLNSRTIGPFTTDYSESLTVDENRTINHHQHPLRDMPRLFSLCRLLEDMIAVSHDKPSDWLDWSTFSQVRSNVELCILEIVDWFNQSVEVPDMTRYRSATAMMLYCMCVFRKFGRDSPTSRNAARLLYESLALSSCETFEETMDEDVMLWVYAVAVALGTSQTEQYPIIRHKFVEITRALGCFGFADTRERLERFVWSDNMHGMLMHSFLPMNSYNNAA